MTPRLGSSIPVVARVSAPTPANGASHAQPAHSEIFAAFASLRSLIDVALAAPEQQRACAELWDHLLAKYRAKAPDEELCCEGLVGIPEAAKFLGISKSGVQNLVASGRIRAVRFPEFERVLIPRRHLVAFCAAHLSGGEP